MTASAFLDDILIRVSRGMGRTSVGGATQSRGERMWKSLTSTGSAFVKRIPGAGVQHPKQLAGQLAYVNGKAKGTFGFASGIAGGDEAFEEAELEAMINTWAQDWKGRPSNGQRPLTKLSETSYSSLASVPQACFRLHQRVQRKRCFRPILAG